MREKGHCDGVATLPWGNKRNIEWRIEGLLKERCQMDKCWHRAMMGDGSLHIEVQSPLPPPLPRGRWLIENPLFIKFTVQLWRAWRVALAVMDMAQVVVLHDMIQMA